jgi:hypothetical protein
MASVIFLVVKSFDVHDLRLAVYSSGRLQQAKRASVLICSGLCGHIFILYNYVYLALCKYRFLWEVAHRRSIRTVDRWRRDNDFARLMYRIIGFANDRHSTGILLLDRNELALLYVGDGFSKEQLLRSWLYSSLWNQQRLIETYTAK